MSASQNKIYFISVNAESAKVRLDRWLADLDIFPSRAKAVELISRGLVTVDGRPVKASQKFTEGTTIRIELPPPVSSELLPLSQPLNILFEDSDLVVINKPAGLVVHPAPGHAQDTLVNILLHHITDLSMGFSEGRPGIVHRLDRDTSGILVVAKNDLAHQALALQFKNKTAQRRYWALAHGQPKNLTGTITSFLTRDPNHRKRFRSSPLQDVGKRAVTHYKVIATQPSGITWFECRLETGRTHQIRVHLSELGHPILFDPIYGSPNKDSRLARLGPLPFRLALHAYELGFLHPSTHEHLLFKQNWPDDLESWIKHLGFSDVPRL